MSQASPDWDSDLLGSLCGIEIGRTPARKSPRFWDSTKATDNVWLSIADMARTDGNVVNDSKEYLSDEGCEGGKTVKEGTLLVSFKLTLGRLAFTGRDLVTNEAIAALTIKDETLLSKEYLYWFLTFFDWDKEAEGDEKVKGKTLNKAKLKMIEIFFPPLLKQKRIVALLDEAFAGISLAVANAEKNLASARELFESYLNNVFTQKGDGWREESLGNVCDLFQGLAINKGTKHLLVKQSSLPLLRIKDLRSGSQEQYVNEEGFPPNTQVTEEDLLYTRTGQIGLVFRGRQGILHNNCFKIVPRTELLRTYFFWWLQGTQFKEAIVRLASRAAQPDITHKLFKSQSIFIPPLKYQKDASEKMEGLHANIQYLESIYQQKLDALAELKQSILQKAFAGELTADAPEELVN